MLNYYNNKIYKYIFMDENRKVEFLKNIFGLVNLNEINDIINSKISLDELFKIHNLNTNLNFFILLMI